MTDHRTEIHIYGDSILKGIIMDRDSGKYIPIPEDDFSSVREQYAVEILNKSKFGFTIDRGTALLNRALRRNRPCDAVVLEYGGNDCNFDWKAVSECPDGAHEPMTPPAVFCTMLRSVIESLRSMQITPVLTSLPPIHAERFLSHIVRTVPGTDREAILWFLKGDVQQIYRYQELYSSMITGIALETGCPFVDLRTGFLDKSGYASLLCEDGIHPNEAGHRLIAGAFLSAAGRFLADLQTDKLPVGA